MADKSHVSVKCDVKDLFDTKLKSGLIKAMTKNVTEAINNKSGGKLSTTAKSDEGFIVTATVTSLKADDKDKPTKLDVKFALIAIAVGSTTKGFNATTGGSKTGVGSKVQEAAEDLVTNILDDLMPKVIKTMLNL
jgi:hypothetical protein